MVISVEINLDSRNVHNVQAPYKTDFLIGSIQSLKQRSCGYLPNENSFGVEILVRDGLFKITHFICGVTVHHVNRLSTWNILDAFAMIYPYMDFV